MFKHHKNLQNKTVRELSPFLTSRETLLKVKGKVYDAFVRTCMIHGSETWAMESSSVERIEKTWDEDGQMDVQDITMWKKEKWRPPPVNGPGKDRTGDEEEQIDWDGMDMWLGEKRPTGFREFLISQLRGGNHVGEPAKHGEKQSQKSV